MKGDFMSLLKRKPNVRKNPPEFTGRGCPLTKNQTKWCYGMCEVTDGLGFCGRVAPHGLSGRTQDAIRNHKAKS